MNAIVNQPLDGHAPTTYESFRAEFDQKIELAAKDSGTVSLALFDVDWCGSLNKEHGRAVGDAVIASVGYLLREALASNAEVSRYGGDAHAVVFPGREKEEAFLLVEKARAGYSGQRVVTVESREVLLSPAVSAGVASYPDDGVKAIDIIRKASEALYRAKVTGRNKVCLAREERMVTKTSHYTQGQLAGLARLAKREGMNEAMLLREAMDDLLRKYNA